MNENMGLFDAAVRLLAPVHDMMLAAALASLRVHAAFAILPALGEQFIQGMTRTGLVLILSLFIAFGLPAGVTEHMTPMKWAIFASKEIMVGLVLGFCASTVFWIAESVGALLDTQAGYNSVQMQNPLSGTQSTPVSNLLLQMMVSVFFVLGGMLVMIGALFESFHIWPLFEALPRMSKIPDLFIVQQTDSMMASVIKFAAPALLILVLIDLGFGIIARSAEKLEPHNLSMPVKGAVTMLMLALLMGVLVTQVRHLLLPTGLLSQVQSSFGKVVK